MSRGSSPAVIAIFASVKRGHRLLVELDEPLLERDRRGRARPRAWARSCASCWPAMSSSAGVTGGARRGEPDRRELGGDRRGVMRLVRADEREAGIGVEHRARRRAPRRLAPPEPEQQPPSSDAAAKHGGRGAAPPRDRRRAGGARTARGASFCSAAPGNPRRTGRAAAASTDRSWSARCRRSAWRAARASAVPKQADRGDVRAQRGVLGGQRGVQSGRRRLGAAPACRPRRAAPPASLTRACARSAQPVDPVDAVRGHDAPARRAAARPRPPTGRPRRFSGGPHPTRTSAPAPNSARRVTTRPWCPGSRALRRAWCTGRRTGTSSRRRRR